jgi:hypothetical protein
MVHHEEGVLALCPKTPSLPPETLYSRRLPCSCSTLPVLPPVDALAGRLRLARPCFAAPSFHVSSVLCFLDRHRAWLSSINVGETILQRDVRADQHLAGLLHDSFVRCQSRDSSTGELG